MADAVAQLAGQFRAAEAKRDRHRKCRTCQYFKEGDPSPVKPYANVGLCIFMLERESGFYDHDAAAPFWATRMTFSVVDYEGTGCATWKKDKVRYALSVAASTR